MIRMLHAYNGYYKNQVIDLGSTEETRLIGLGLAVADVAPGGAGIPVAISFSLTSADDGKVFACTAALTITIPATLSPRPSVIVIPPPSGNVSIAVSGGAQLNGATTTLTFSRANSPAGIEVTPYAEYDGYGVGAGGTGVAYSPVTLSANTTLTRASHYNRQIVADTTAGNITLTATGTDALLGDFISIDVIGGNSVTLAGVTAQSGYTLTAASGGTVEAKSTADASFIAATRSVSTAGGDLTVPLVDGSFTSNNLNLTSAHTNCVLDLSAVTIPVTLTWQTDAAGGYDTSSCKLRVLAGPVAPVAIIAGAGATLIGGAQVIEQGGWGGGHRTAANTLALNLLRKGNQSLASTLSQFGMSAPAGWGASALTNSWMIAPSAVDSCTGAAANNSADGSATYGGLRRFRYTGAAATNRSTGIQHILNARLDTINSMFPVTVSAGMPDGIATAPIVMGLCSNLAVGTALNSAEPSTASTLDLIALGADSGDANMQIMHRNGGSSTAATKVDLGASFPKAQWNAYELTIYKNNAGTAFLVVVQNLVTKAFTVKVITTNVPRNTVSYHSIYIRSSWGGVSAALDYINCITGASA
jgi:hypothetical protein